MNLRRNGYDRMKFDLIIGNPPYTDGTTGNGPIYHKIIMANTSSQQAWIIPTGWFHSDYYAKFRTWLFDNGLYKIVMNPNDTFSNVTVFTCCIFLQIGYKGEIAVKLGDVTYDFDYRKYGELVITDCKRLTADILNNKPLSPYKFKSNPAIKHNISQIPVEGWHKIVTKITQDHVEFGFVEITPQNRSRDVQLLTSRAQGFSQIAVAYMIAVPHMPCGGKGLSWWRLTRFAIVPADVLVCYKYRSLFCETETQAKLIRDYLQSDYVTTIFKWTRSSRTLDNSQLKFIPRLTFSEI